MLVETYPSTVAIDELAGGDAAAVHCVVVRRSGNGTATLARRADSVDEAFAVMRSWVAEDPGQAVQIRAGGWTIASYRP